jgi:hypothetical protein
LSYFICFIQEHDLRLTSFTTNLLISLKVSNTPFPFRALAEKDGTFTNTERKVKLVRKAIEHIGMARQDWEIICDLSTRMGYPMSYDHPSQILEEVTQLTPSYGGIYYDRIEKDGLHWPCPNRAHPGTPYLHKDRFSRGLGLFHAIEYLDQLIQTGKLKFKDGNPMKVAYHDPCDLGRHLNIFEPPRELLKKIPGVTLVEFKNNRLLAKCCGGGGGKSGKGISTCTRCEGKGQIRQVRGSLFGQMVSVSTCPACGGEGQVVSDPCTRCSGEARTALRVTSAPVPAGG